MRANNRLGGESIENFSRTLKPPSEISPDRSLESNEHHSVQKLPLEEIFRWDEKLNIKIYLLLNSQFSTPLEARQDIGWFGYN